MEELDKMMNGRSDVENLVAREDDFSEKRIRQGFKKSFLILMTQLLVAFGIVSLFTTAGTVNNFVKNPTLILIAYYYLSMLMAVVCFFLYHYYSNVRLMNIMLSFVLTCTGGFLLGYISVWREKEPQGILIALGITAVICLALIAFAFQTKWDFTGMHAFAFSNSIAVLQYCILLVILSVAGAMLFISIFLVFDAQLGTSAPECTAEACDLYTGIIAAFYVIFAFSLIIDNNLSYF